MKETSWYMLDTLKKTNLSFHTWSQDVSRTLVIGTFLPPSVLSWRHFQSTSCWGVEIKNNQLTSSHSMYSGHGKCPSGSVSVSGAKITFKRLSKDFINPWKKSRRRNMFWPPSVFMTQLQRLWTHSFLETAMSLRNWQSQYKVKTHQRRRHHARYL